MGVRCLPLWRLKACCCKVIAWLKLQCSIATFRGSKDGCRWHMERCACQFLDIVEHSVFGRPKAEIRQPLTNASDGPTHCLCLSNGKMHAPTGKAMLLCSVSFRAHHCGIVVLLRWGIRKSNGAMVRRWAIVVFKTVAALLLLDLRDFGRMHAKSVEKRQRYCQVVYNLQETYLTLFLCRRLDLCLPTIREQARASSRFRHQCRISMADVANKTNVKRAFLEV